MIGVCCICKELLPAAPAPPGVIDGAEVARVEFVNLAEAARAHLYGRHPDQAKAFAPVVHAAVLLVSSGIVESGPGDLWAQMRQRWREQFAEMLDGAEAVGACLRSRCACLGTPAQLEVGSLGS